MATKKAAQPALSVVKELHEISERRQARRAFRD